MLLVSYMWASMTFLPYMWASMTFWPEEVCVKIRQLCFSVHEIDHLLKISMNRTVEQLAENSGEKKELLNELK